MTVTPESRDVVLNIQGAAIIKNVASATINNVYGDYFTSTDIDKVPYRMLSDYMVIMHNLYEELEKGGVEACCAYMTQVMMAKMIIITNAKMFVNPVTYKNTGIVDISTPIMYDISNLYKLKSISRTIKFRYSHRHFNPAAYPLVNNSSMEIEVDLYDIAMNKAADLDWINGISRIMKNMIEAVATMERRELNEYLKTSGDPNKPAWMQDTISQKDRDMAYLCGLYYFLNQYDYADIVQDEWLKKVTISYANLYTALSNEGTDVSEYKLYWMML